ncbi:MAG: HD domain-containing protein [Rivularia sp. ALOHA_DT_140]|nr:HD domain-containing protein [Rivularia sp. ALOHA_DT_140]
MIQFRALDNYQLLTMKISIENIINLYTEQGSQMYGSEAVTQLEHALQCATLAEEACQSKEIITACLLHDLGHLIHDFGDKASIQGINDLHEYRALAILQKLFEPAVTEPIRLHVAAKRYLCAVSIGYWEKLSEESKRSLELQGGVFSLETASGFIRQPYAKYAVQLRMYDDQAKVADKLTPSLTHFKQYMDACLRMVKTV